MPASPCPRKRAVIRDFSLGARAAILFAAYRAGRTLAPGASTANEVSPCLTARVQLFEFLDAAVAAVLCQRTGGKPPVSLAVDQSLSVDAFGVSPPWSPRVRAVGLGPDATIDRTLVIDVASSIVGDTSAVSTTPWFHLHGAPAAGDRHHSLPGPAARHAPCLPADRRARRLQRTRADAGTAAHAAVRPWRAATTTIARSSSVG